MKRVYETYNGKMYDVSGFMAEVKDIGKWENGEIGDYFFETAQKYEFNYKDGTYTIHDGIEQGEELGDLKTVTLITKTQAKDFEEFWEGECGQVFKYENMEDGKLYLCEEHFDINDNRPNRAWLVRNGKDITDYLNGKTDNLVKADVLCDIQ